MASGVELRKAVIKNADMSEEMQADAVDCATQALEKYNIEKDIAAYIVVLVMLAVKPNGLFGDNLRKKV